MMVQFRFSFILILMSLVLERALAIMVPTGKVGPITPPRRIEPISTAINEVSYREPASVWERVDEGPNPYAPPVYKYTLLDYARKYVRKTLIPREDQYYNPPPKQYYPDKFYYYSNKLRNYYSPLQYL